MTAARLHTRESIRLNGAIVALVLAFAFVQYVAVPVALAHSLGWGFLLVPVALAANTLWSLIHEAIHGLLFPSRRVNDAVGRLLGVAFGAPFRALRAGHLVHHRYSRTVRERAEVFDPARTSRLAASLAYYPRLLGGMYLIEVAGAFASLLPARALAWLEPRVAADDSVAGLVVHALRQPQALEEVRRDTLACVALFAGGFVLYGVHAWMLAAALAVRALAVSMADNSYHYDTPLDRPREAMDVSAPHWLTALLLDFNLHGVHHRHPALPWFALSARFREENGRHAVGWFEAVLRQLRGPLPVTRFGA